MIFIASGKLLQLGGRGSLTFCPSCVTFQRVSPPVRGGAATLSGPGSLATPEVRVFSPHLRVRSELKRLGVGEGTVTGLTEEMDSNDS